MCLTDDPKPHKNGVAVPAEPLEWLHCYNVPTIPKNIKTNHYAKFCPKVIKDIRNPKKKKFKKSLKHTKKTPELSKHVYNFDNQKLFF